MKKSHIVISDITCMKEKFCIAGFDTYEKRMKRLMIDGGYWNTDQIPPSYCEILVDNEEFKEPRKDVVGLNSTVAVSQYAHCRIGLARKFLMQENHCYLMLNGLFLY